MKVAVVSSVYGDYDRIYVPAEQSVKTDWIMVTDRENVPAPWVSIVEPRPRVPARLASRVAKCNPWLYTNADVVVWKDGNIEVTSPQFVEACLNLLGDDIICQRQQFQRKDIWDEVKASFEETKWANDPLNEQAEYYISQGYPADYGIWWCGLMIRSKKCFDFGDEWMHEMVRWTCQDQMAHSFLMHRYGIKPAPLSMETQGFNALFNLRHHPDNTK